MDKKLQGDRTVIRSPLAIQIRVYKENFFHFLTFFPLFFDTKVLSRTPHRRCLPDIPALPEKGSKS